MSNLYYHISNKNELEYLNSKDKITAELVQDMLKNNKSKTRKTSLNNYSLNLLPKEIIKKNNILKDIYISKANIERSQKIIINPNKKNMQNFTTANTDEYYPQNNFNYNNFNSNTINTNNVLNHKENFNDKNLNAASTRKGIIDKDALVQASQHKTTHPQKNNDSSNKIFSSFKDCNLTHITSSDATMQHKDKLILIDSNDKHNQNPYPSSISSNNNNYNYNISKPNHTFNSLNNKHKQKDRSNNPTVKAFNNNSSINKSLFNNHNTKNKNSFLNNYNNNQMNMTSNNSTSAKFAYDFKNNNISNKINNPIKNNKPNVLKSSFIVGGFEKQNPQNTNYSISPLQQANVSNINENINNINKGSGSLYLIKDSETLLKKSSDNKSFKNKRKASALELENINELNKLFLNQLKPGGPVTFDKVYKPINGFNYTNEDPNHIYSLADSQSCETFKAKENNKNTRSKSFHVFRYDSANNSKPSLIKGNSAKQKNLTNQPKLTENASYCEILEAKHSIDGKAITDKAKNFKIAKKIALLHLKKQYDEILKKKRLPISFIAQSIFIKFCIKFNANFFCLILAFYPI